MIDKDLGHFRVLEKIGEGGMGEVYRAKDTKLGRDVAIKVLPDEFAENEERLARFQREAKVLASLNHPGIASIYGVERAESTHYLVLELVTGETLAERIARGPIPVDEAVGIAVKIAEALEEAHEQGIVHRDLKPANIKLTPDDKVKVLDFGLAKAFVEETPEADSSMSPTITRDATRMGVILGTAAYMSPEQAKGKSVDKRTDIFAFGAVIYEMLTAKKAFPGENVSEVLAAVMKDEPDWNPLPAIPASVDGLLRRCFDKDAKRRLRDIGEARLALERPTDFSATEPGKRRSGLLTWVVSSLGAGMLVGVTAARWLSPGAGAIPAPVVRFDIPVAGTSNGHLPSSFAFTPDASQLVLVRSVGGASQLFRRSFRESELVAIRGTEGGSAPFLSPDGEWIGFHADGNLKKVLLEGGPAATICEWPEALGASWGETDEIVFSSEGGLWEVAAAGGAPEPLPGGEASTATIYSPEILPGADAVLFTEDSGPDSRIGVLSRENGEKRILVEGAYPRFTSSGHIFFVRDETVWVVPFDARSLELTGEAMPVLEHVHIHGDRTGAQFAISRNGSLAYSTGLSIESRAGGLTFVDRSGSVTALSHEPAEYQFPRFSPDGRRLAVTVRTGTNNDIWILDLDRPTRTRFTFSDLDSRRAVWTPDGSRIAFSSRATGAGDLFWKAADGTEDAELLLKSTPRKQPGGFSPDGRTLLYWNLRSGNNRDIWTLTLDEEPVPFVATPYNERAPRFSPDGGWVAYVSNESGRDEVYVRPYPGPSGAILVSTDGGTEPVWSPDGRELFFRVGGKMMATPMRKNPAVSFGTPELLFEGSYRSDPNGGSYDVGSDGQRFIMVPLISEGATAQIHVVVNWFQELDRLVSTNK